MAPIDGVSDIIRMPRLGKVRLGVKKEGQRSSYPEATDYFVCPEEVRLIHGDQPKELPIMFPSDSIEEVASQFLKCYSYSQGLICKGDGKTSLRKVDSTTGDFANRDTTLWEMKEAGCEPNTCPKIPAKQCRKVMSLIFILPDVPGLGVYQLDTSSFYSIVNVNSQLAPDGFLRHFTKNDKYPAGRIAFIPLILSIEPQEVTPAGVGRKTVHILKLRADVKLSDIIRASRKAIDQVLLPALSEEEAPGDLFPADIIEGDYEEIMQRAAEEETATDQEYAARQAQADEEAMKKAIAKEEPWLQDKEKPRTAEDITEDDVPDKGAVLRLAWEFWGKQPADACRQLGFETQLEYHGATTNPWDLFLSLKEVLGPVMPKATKEKEK